MRHLFKSVCLFLWVSCNTLHAHNQSSIFQVFFSSEVQLDKEFIRLINEEKKSIHFAVFHFSHYPIAEALLRARRRGVEIILVVDTCSVKKKSAVQKLIKAGIPVYVFHSEESEKMKRGRILMHHKFCLFGEERVWSGSCNFTRALSSSHRENALLVSDETVAQCYNKEFKNLVQSALPLPLSTESPK